MTKSLKVLKLFYELLNKGTVSIDEAKFIIEDNQQHFNKYVKRYVNTINDFIEEADGLSISMDDKQIKLHKDNALTVKMVYTIMLVLTGSKALSKDELVDSLNSLIQLLNEDSKNQVKSLLKRDIEAYEPTAMTQDYFDLLFQLGVMIEQEQCIQIEYINTFNQMKTHNILPKHIVFHHYYFYLIGINERGFLTNMRIDRINGYKTVDIYVDTTEYEQVSFSNYVTKMKNMFHGEHHRVQFEMYGPFTEYVFDEFPDAKVIKKDYDKHHYKFEVETYGFGIVYWLLSQANRVKVLSPKVVVDEYKKELKQMLGYYF